MLFLGAFFPQFVDFAMPLQDQLVILGFAFVLTLTVVDALMACAAGGAHRWLTPSRWRVMDGFGGTLLLGGGIWLALQQRA